MKQGFLLLVLTVLSFQICLAQDSGRENGMGIRLTGDVTFNRNNPEYDNAVFPRFYKRVWGAQLGVYYKYFIANSHYFIEPQLTGYYFGHKDANMEALDPDINQDLAPHNLFNEWGTTLSASMGYSFFVGNDHSLDLFTGPELRCAITSKAGKRNLLTHLYNRWQMRWKLGFGYNYSHIGVQLYGAYDVSKKSKLSSTRDFTLSLGLSYKF